ncbi:NACHT domain protein, partial [Escherichia coli]|nr:hypothetical protein [Escherichia coli]MDT8636884.1 hypothetical protein [Escherichia coli]
MSGIIYSIDSIEPDNKLTKKMYYAKLSDVVDRLNKKEYIKKMIMEITSALHYDVFSSNKALIERKNNALSDIFGL